jgi:hypothetical protein
MFGAVLEAASDCDCLDGRYLTVQLILARIANLPSNNVGRPYKVLQVHSNLGIMKSGSNSFEKPGMRLF